MLDHPHSAVWVWTNCDYFEDRWVKHSKPRPIQGSSYKAELYQRKPQMLFPWQLISEAAIDEHEQHLS
jgi:hypothetical protein